jgi:hypothetical protein
VIGNAPVRYRSVVAGALIGRGLPAEITGARSNLFPMAFSQGTERSSSGSSKIPLATTLCARYLGDRDQSSRAFAGFIGCSSKSPATFHRDRVRRLSGIERLYQYVLAPGLRTST